MPASAATSTRRASINKYETEITPHGTVESRQSSFETALSLSLCTPSSFSIIRPSGSFGRFRPNMQLQRLPPAVVSRKTVFTTPNQKRENASHTPSLLPELTNGTYDTLGSPWAPVSQSVSQSVSNKVCMESHGSTFISRRR